jgi:isopentenyl-diphosphate delta-isomerase
MRKQNSVVLVDMSGCDLLDVDGRISTMGKIKAHRQGVLHRAVSVFIFNERNDFLLQKRAANKYHSPRKWANTCCTHPLPGETPLDSAQRRLYEEMGLVTPLTEVFTFLYQADVGNKLTEYEFDHIFFGLSNINPKPNPVEVSDWAWVNIEKLKEEIRHYPDKYTVWLRQCFDKVVNQRLIKIK